MYCTKKITDDLIWVGANDRRLAMFEGVYSVPRGVSYNAYLLLDDINVLFDTVDKAVGKTFFENLEHALNGKNLDFVVIQHMEPDHSATLMELLLRYPNTKVVCNQKILTMIQQFFQLDLSGKAFVVKENDTLSTGHHKLKFLFAPMVHWPEVMVTYDETTGTLFSADAFGTFGALNGAIFADEVDFENEYMDEARRYYCNIVGKYGPQVQSLLKKAHGLDLKMICPLHGPVLKENLGFYIGKYLTWSSYEPEEDGVLVACASIHGNTKAAAEKMVEVLRANGASKVVFMDLTRDDMAEAVADAFRYGKIILAAASYDAGVFPPMEDFLHRLVHKNLQKRTFGLIENGSWAPCAARGMKGILEGMKEVNVCENVVSIKSTMKDTDVAKMEELAKEILA